MPPKQTQWSETSSIVGQSFRLNKAIAHKIPSAIRFTEDDKKLFFLGGCGRSTLFSVDLEQPVASSDIPLEHTQFFDNSYVPKSREEEVSRQKRDPEVAIIPYFSHITTNLFDFLISFFIPSCYERDREYRKFE